MAKKSQVPLNGRWKEFSRRPVWPFEVGPARKAVDVMTRLRSYSNKQHPAPTHFRMDNGPGFYWPMPCKEWCNRKCTGFAYIPPGSPWENPFVESFNGRLPGMNS